MIKSIFLSSESDSSLPIRDFCQEHHIGLVRKSLISFQKIAFQVPPDWDVVFFASPRSFDFFISDDFSLGSHQQIACIGLGTRKHIESKGYPVSFFGENAGVPEEIAHQFKDWLENRVALFPQSVKSNKSIESVLPPAQKIPLIVYNTIENPVQLSEPFSLYVFTSPSNYSSFRSRNTIPQDAKVIAWGHSTAEILMDNDEPVHFILETSTYSELLPILKNL